ncbi:MAG: EF-hand domain-containing protein [Verrucomicrobiota bacterium]
MKTTTLLATLGLTAVTALAQGQRRPDGDRPPHHPPPPIIATLDANHDGVIDADEIANAPAALKTLDKNGDGQLTPDELRPPRPEVDEGDDHRPPPPPPDAE